MDEKKEYTDEELVKAGFTHRVVEIDPNLKPVDFRPSSKLVNGNVLAKTTFLVAPHGGAKRKSFWTSVDGKQSLRRIAPFVKKD